MRTCLNRNVVVGLALAAGAVLVWAPQAFLATLPFLIVLACPLSMALMMRTMGGDRHGKACSTGRPGGQNQTSMQPVADDPAHDSAVEVARLRAEVDQLQATLRDRQ